MSELESLPPRIIGTELEYGATLHHRPVEDDEKLMSAIHLGVARNSLASYALPGAAVDGFMANGARLYSDAGDHPEYATPEDVSILGTVANEIAGERHMHTVMERRQAAEDAVGFELNRRLINSAGAGEDSRGVSWGHHENYSHRRETLSLSSWHTVAAHLATRNLYTGAGALLPDGQFQIAQKAAHLSRFVLDSTMNLGKPLISLRDEPHARKAESGRLHVVGGDAPFSPWAMMMQLGTVSLVLDVLEHGRPELVKALKRIEFFTSDEAKLIAVTAADLTMRRTICLMDGDKVRPLNIQYEFLAAAKQLAEDVDVGDEKRLVLQEWEQALADIEDDPFKLYDRADWPVRYKYLQRYRDKGGLPAMYQADLNWDSLRHVGVAKALRSRLWGRFMPSEALIEERMTQPPDSTRAALRGRLIEYCVRHERLSTSQFDWSHVLLRNQQIDMPDPLANNLPETEVQRMSRRLSLTDAEQLTDFRRALRGGS